jgi:cytochrome c biogenesis protein CcmG, thiol:disulfide interchange protein DsbE
LPAAAGDRAGLSDTDFRGGKPRLLNIFASWCVPCAVEAPVLGTLAAHGWQVNGIAIRDDRADLAAFLMRNGNPYTQIGADEVSAVQMAMGSSGVPESFIVDGQGVIRYQHIGVIMPNQMAMIEDKLREAGK